MLDGGGAMTRQKVKRCGRLAVSKQAASWQKLGISNATGRYTVLGRQVSSDDNLKTEQDRRMYKIHLIEKNQINATIKNSKPQLLQYNFYPNPKAIKNPI